MSGNLEQFKSRTKKTFKCIEDGKCRAEIPDDFGVVVTDCIAEISEVTRNISGQQFEGK